MLNLLDNPTLAQMIPSSNYVCKNDKNFDGRHFENEMVIMNLETDDYVCVNAVGTSILSLLDEPIQFSDLLHKVQTRYNPPGIEWIKEVNDFIKRLAKEKLVIILPN